MESASYRRGYLTGMIRGDGMLLRRTYTRPSGTPNNVSMFRLALADGEALTRTKSYLEQEGITTRQRPFTLASAQRRAMNAIHTARADHFDAISRIVDWPDEPDAGWNAGYLAGIFDAEGSCSRGILRISNTDSEIHDKTKRAMAELGISYVHEPQSPSGVSSIRVVGGLPMRSRFFTLTAPAITRKLDLVGRAVKSDARLQVVSIEDLGEDIDMIDITTGTGDFIANGVVSHNCFARNTHTYLDLDAGADFDYQIIVKINVAEVLAKELSKPTLATRPGRARHQHRPVPARRGPLRAHARHHRGAGESGTPFSILTKGTLLRRDLPLLAEARRRCRSTSPCRSPCYDDELQTLDRAGHADRRRPASRPSRAVREARARLRRVPDADPAVPDRLARAPR